MSNLKGTVLVTGGSGFLASHIVDALSDDGYQVRIFDRQASPYLREGQEMIIGDITDRAAVNQAAQGCDYIYHFAGIADIEECNARPHDAAQVNIIGTLNVLQAAKENNVKRFAFASTVYVYSSLGGFYRVSKQACENMIELYGVPYTILRYGSLYGRRAGSTNGIYKLIKSGIQTDKITYNGDPEAQREYIHVKDAARLSVDILDKKYANRHMILTGQERVRVADLMQMISEILPNKPKLKFAKEHSAHYTMTPYEYTPRTGTKMTANEHVDLGQGILDCVEDLYNELNLNSAAAE